MKRRLFWVNTLSILFFGIGVFLAIELKAPPSHLSSVTQGANQKIYSQSGELLNVQWDNSLNSSHKLPLHKIPVDIQRIFVFAEDKNFFQHNGIDWLARFSAIYQNIKNRKIVRGASTITEQVIRMIHPRPRTLTSKVLETIEAWWLEYRVSKGEIFEFYLNQIPYASNRRGVAQAAEYYFSRTLETLNISEKLALVVLIRSPSRWDLYKSKIKINEAVDELARQLRQQNLISQDEYASIDLEGLVLISPNRQPKPFAFLEFVQSKSPKKNAIQSTLDSKLQLVVEDLLNERVEALEHRNVENAAALVVDHSNGHILAYAVSGKRKKTIHGSFFDAIQVPRQPGSTLKPFLYGLALENNYSAAHVLMDSPLSEAVGTGIHQFKNYSRTNYGPVTVRQALGNSLNIPAIRMIDQLGVGTFLGLLQDLQFSGLDKGLDFYGKGLALGNAEVSLYELVRAYTALANRGKLRELTFDSENRHTSERRVFNEESSSLISNVMSDPLARNLEFGSSRLFNFPVQTAIKTGTSTDFKDAWVMAFNDKYLIGIWMGNLSQQPMNHVTGSFGPAIVARSIFNELNKRERLPSLFLSSQLEQKDICMEEGEVRERCSNAESRRFTEWFYKDVQFSKKSVVEKKQDIFRVGFPTQGLIIAIDPRLPRDDQQIKFQLENPDQREIGKVHWFLNGDQVDRQWPVVPGNYKLKAKVISKGLIQRTSPQIRFTVVE